MHKVIVERPRGNKGPHKLNRRASLSIDSLPKFEGIKRAYRERKWQRDLLGPLRRWLCAQVGRPWNDVYGDACKVIHPNNYVRVHVKTHLLQYVQCDTFMHEGQVSYLCPGIGIRSVLSVSFVRRVFYVHPETGSLEKIEPVSRKRLTAEGYQRAVEPRWVGRNSNLQQIRGLWYECHFQIVPVNGQFKAYDHLLGRVVGRGELAKRDDHYCLCIRKRQLSRRELRHYGVNNAPGDATGAQPSASHVCLLKIMLRVASALAAAEERRHIGGAHREHPVRGNGLSPPAVCKQIATCLSARACGPRAQ